MQDATTVSFRQQRTRKPQVKAVPSPSRSHAETVFRLAELGLRGALRLPKAEDAARELEVKLEARLKQIREKADHLAQSRTTEGAKAADISRLLLHWMIHGKPARTVGSR